MAKPVHIAAIDAGSNAIRLAVARAESASKFFVLKTLREPVRLGHNVFVEGSVDAHTMRGTITAFRKFAAAFEEFGVADYRAVTTSALRNATNSAEIIERIYGETGILLEVISGDEEARLIRKAVFGRLNKDSTPGMILDLGGGSLEINLLEPRSRRVRQCVTLPLGTVRLMEGLDIRGEIKPADAKKIVARVQTQLRTHFPDKTDLSEGIAVACGGNAEALSKIAKGYSTRGVRTLDLPLLEILSDDMNKMSVAERMRSFGVRRDRAEVMAIAAIVLVTLAKRFNINFMLVPGVGVRDGVIAELAAAKFKKKKK